MYGLGPVPFKDGCAVTPMDMSTKYEVILLTNEGPKVRCKWEDGTKGLKLFPDTKQSFSAGSNCMESALPPICRSGRWRVFGAAEMLPR
jgi:hypothetical protein